MPKVIANAKENILEAAKNMLIEQGYNTLNMRDIAKESNVGLGTVYNYFKSKKEIVREIVLIDWTKCLNSMDEFCSEQQDVMSGLRLVFSELKRFVDIYKDIWMAIYMQSEIRPKINELHNSHKGFFNDLKSRISLLFDNNHLNIENRDFVESFITKNFAMYSMDPSFQYKNFECIIKKILN
jgi:AcrR family transcriptional regulator